MDIHNRFKMKTGNYYLFKITFRFIIIYFILHNILTILEIMFVINIYFFIYILAIFISMFFAISKFKLDVKRIPSKIEKVKISLFSLIPYWLTSIPEQYILTGNINGQLEYNSFTNDISISLIDISLILIYFLVVFCVFFLFQIIASWILAKKKLRN